MKLVEQQALLRKKVRRHAVDTTMDAVTMLRDLWRHRFALVGVLALSALAGILVLYAFSPPFGLQSRKYTVGVANTRVLIDTPSSQVAAIAPEGSGDLGMRADLLSRIMVEGTVKAEIARAAGVHPNQLFGVSLSAVDDMAARKPPRNASLLTTEVVVASSTTQLPLIQIEARAGDAASAARIADAAVKGLRNYVDEQAVDTNVPAQRRVRVTPLGVTQAETAVRGPKSVFAVIAAIFVFGLGCAFVLALAALGRGWRRATAGERPVPGSAPGRLTSTRIQADQEEPASPVTVGSLLDGEPNPPIEDIRPAPLRQATTTQSRAKRKSTKAQPSSKANAKNDRLHVASPRAKSRVADDDEPAKANPRGERRRSAS